MEEEKRHEEETADIMVPENSTYQEVKHVMEREPMSSDNLRQLFDQFFNDNRNEDVRNSSMQLITSLWSTGKMSLREELMLIMEEKSKLLMQYGNSTKEFFQLFSNMCIQIVKDSQREQSYQVQAKRLFRALISVFSGGLKQLLSHPDHVLYQFLEDVVDDFNVFKPQFLEANGCLNCYCQSEQFELKEEKLAAISSEIRAGSFKLVMKLKKTMDIQAITMPRDPSYTKTKRNLVKTITVYVNNSLSADMNSLRNDMTHWQKIKVSNFETETGRDYIITLPVSVSARYLCIEFTTVQKLPSQCTRCQEVRTENSGFYCIQCQYCSLIQIENSTVKYKPSFSPDSVAIESDKAKENCDASIAEYTSKIQETRKELLKEKQRMRILYDRYNGTKCNNSTGILLNSDELDRLYQDLMTNVNYLMAHRKALAQYNGMKQDSFKQFSSLQGLESNQVPCYGCLHSFLANFLSYIHKRENMQIVIDLTGIDVVDEFLRILEDIYDPSQSRAIPAKIISQTMRIHKSFLVMILGERQQTQLQNLINNLRDDLLAVKFSDLNGHPQPSYLKLKTRILDVKALQESLRGQIDVNNSIDLPTQQDLEQLQKLTDLSSSIVQLPNVVIPSLFSRSTPIPIAFQNEVFAPLLEIIVSEITSCQPSSQRSSSYLPASHSELPDRKPQNSKPIRQYQGISSREPYTFGNNPFGALPQSSSNSINPAWRQQELLQREQFFNQMYADGVPGFQGLERLSWGGNFGQFMQQAQQPQQDNPFPMPSFANQKKEKKQPDTSRQSQPQSGFGLPPPSSFNPPAIPSNPSVPQPQIPKISHSSIQSAAKKKESSGNTKKRRTQAKLNQQDKLIDLFTILIGQKDKSDGSSSSVMEVEGQSQREWLETYSSKQIKQDVPSQNFKLKADNWLQKSLELLDSRRLQELIHIIVIAFAQIYSRTACTLMLHALPKALDQQDNSKTYFDLFREVIQLFNAASIRQDSQHNFKKLPGLSMVHQQSSEDAGFARKTQEEDDKAEEFENLNILTTMFRNLDSQLKIYEKLQNKQLISTKDFAIQNLESGQTMISLANLIKTLTENVSIKQVFKNNSKHFMHNILNAIVSLRKFKFILNQNFYQIEVILSSLFQELHANSLNDKQNFLSSLVSALSENSDDPLGQEFLMEQVNKILIPKKIIPNIRLDVQSNQKEYLPSTRQKKDFPASEFGTTMNDILLRIKSELADPTWAIEMLVANKLINNKDLPIELVFKKVWVPHQLKGQSLANVDWKKQVQSGPMVITYRITGFDGEAIEELVDQIVDEEQTTCLQLSRVLFEVREGQNEENCGITSLTKIIKNIYQDSEQKSKLLSIITILNTTCQHAEGRKLMLKYGGLGIILRVLMKYLPSMNESEPESLVNNIFELLHGLLNEVEKEKLEVNLGGSLDIKSTEEECLANVEVCIDKIHKIEEKSKVLTNKIKSQQLLADLGRILPIITYDYPKPSQFLVNVFQSAIQFQDQCKKQINFVLPSEKYDFFSKLEMKQENLDLIQKYIEIAEKIPEEFQSFREESVKQGILEKATQAFISVIPTFNDINQDKAQAQKNCLKRCLQVFIGLSKGNYLVQKILNDQGILHSIYQLADPSIKIEEVGKLSEVLVEYIVNEKNNVDKQVQASIIKIKQEEMQRKKEKADQVKKNQLSMLNTNAQKVLLSFNLQDIEEEHSIKCVVCQEGYNLRPSEIMGAYVLTVNAVIPDDKKLLLEGILADKTGASSVTSFNCIHLKCHNEAVQADQNSKKPKTEWEGALIRNSEAKCNNWFPLKGPEIEKQHMDAGLKKYMSAGKNQSGSTLLWNLICDFRGLLLKFASQEDIAKETRTTFEHNLKIFPFFISAIGYVASQNEHKDTLSNIQTQLKKMLAKEIKEENRKLEFLHTFLVLSLFVVTPEEWKSTIRKQFLERILQLFVTSYFKANSDFDSRVCKYGQSSLILFALVNLIFTHIHAQALNAHEGTLSLFHQKLDGYISCNYDTLIEKFQSLYGDYRDKITKFTKFSEFLDYCDARKDILESAEEINTVLSNYRE